MDEAAIIQTLEQAIASEDPMCKRIGDMVMSKPIHRAQAASAWTAAKQELEAQGIPLSPKLAVGATSPVVGASAPDCVSSSATIHEKTNG